MTPERLFGLAATLAVVGCGGQREREGATAPTAHPPPRAACPALDAPRRVGTLHAPAVVEASGLVSSRKNPDVLWVHNDSGNPEQLFAMHSDGTLLATFSISESACVDWEDLAIGQESAGGPWFLYVADTGTNRSPRARTTIYRVPEPDIDPSTGPIVGSLEGAAQFSVIYPDRESHDAETLLFDPIERHLYIVTKTTTGVSGVYRLPLPLVAGRDEKLELVAELATPSSGERGSERTTAGDISPDGRMILVKTYTEAFLWPRPPGVSVAEAMNSMPCRVPLAVEPQGEAIGFAADGSGYFTVSEGAGQPIYFMQRRL